MVVACHPNAGHDQERAEDVDRRVKRVQQSGAHDDEERTQGERADDPPEEDAPPVRGGNREVREDEREDEDVVERKALLDQEPGDVLLRLLATSPREENE